MHAPHPPHLVPLTRVPDAAEASFQHKVSFAQDLLGALNTFLDNKDDDDIIIDES